MVLKDPGTWLTEVSAQMLLGIRSHFKSSQSTGKSSNLSGSRANLLLSPSPSVLPTGARDSGVPLQKAEKQQHISSGNPPVTA